LKKVCFHTIVTNFNAIPPKAPKVWLKDRELEITTRDEQSCTSERGYTVGDDLNFISYVFLEFTSDVELIA